MSNKKYFSDEYSPVSTTENTYIGEAGTKSKTEPTEDLRIEKELYCDSKPERIIIKAKLIDG